MSNIWVVTIARADVEDGEGVETDTLLHATREGAGKAAYEWYLEWTGDDCEEEPETPEVRDQLFSHRPERVELERGAWDLVIAIEQREVGE